MHVRFFPTVSPSSYLSSLLRDSHTSSSCPLVGVSYLLVFLLELTVSAYDGIPGFI